MIRHQRVSGFVARPKRVLLLLLGVSLTGFADVMEIPAQFLGRGENSPRRGRASGDNIVESEHRVPP